MIALIDNFDSFTYNLVQRLGEINPAIDLAVYRNNQISVAELQRLQPERLIISPGPCTPNEAGISVPCIQAFAGKVPLLGVCLGHQSIGQAFGGTIVRAKRLMHGKTDLIYHKNSKLFAGLESPFTATRYHSLVIDPPTLSPDFVVTAWADGPDGVPEIMAVEHKHWPIFGVQFHPESFLTTRGTDILARFLEI